MKKVICDICKLNTANKRYKVKRSELIVNPEVYTFYGKVDICDECHIKLFGRK